MNKYTLLAGAAVLALSTTGAKAIDIPTSSTTTLTANIELVSTITITNSTPLDFGKFVSIPGQTITLSSDYDVSSGEHPFTTTFSGGATVPDPEDPESTVNLNAMQLGNPTPGVITLSSQGMDFAYDYNNDGADAPAVDYLLGVFDLQFEDIDMYGPNSEPCGTVTPSYDTHAYDYHTDNNYSKDYSTMYIGGTFTQADTHIHGQCTGTGTVTLILHN